jgi:hypothetical protein
MPATGTWPRHPDQAQSNLVCWKAALTIETEGKRYELAPEDSMYFAAPRTTYTAITAMSRQSPDHELLSVQSGDRLTSEIVLGGSFDGGSTSLPPQT